MTATVALKGIPEGGFPYGLHTLFQEAHDRRHTMKQFRFYKGEPVKKMRRDGDAIVLLFVSKSPGQRGRSIRVSQLDWETHGGWKQVASTRMDDLRPLVTS